MSLTSTVAGERGCSHHVLAWEENDLQTLTCRPGLVPEPPGTAWADEECQCRFFTGGDNFFFSDEMPGGPHCSIVRVFRMSSCVHCMSSYVLPVRHSVWRGGDGLLGPHEEESPGAASSSDSESSDDSEPGPE